MQSMGIKNHRRKVNIMEKRYIISYHNNNEEVRYRSTRGGYVSSIVDAYLYSRAGLSSFVANITKYDRLYHHNCSQKHCVIEVSFSQPSNVEYGSTTTQRTVYYSDEQPCVNFLPKPKKKVEKPLLGTTATQTRWAVVKVATGEYMNGYFTSKNPKLYTRRYDAENRARQMNHGHKQEAFKAMPVNITFQ